MDSDQQKENEEAPSRGGIPLQGRLAGVDFGTVRIGIAICDAGQNIASPIEVYQRRDPERDEKYFQELVRNETIVGFVIGLPVHMSGDASQKSREASSFGRWLSELTELPVVYVDERYTTAQARQLLSGAKLSGKKKKAKLDQIAAQLILSTYLESRETAIEPLDEETSG